MTSKIEHMFEDLLGDVPYGGAPSQVDLCVPHPAFDDDPAFDDGRGFDEAAWDELLRDEPTGDVPGPDGPLVRQVPEPYGACEPSGWLALELDTGTTDAAALADDALIEAIVGFDRLTSWAAARQGRLLAELLRRRPRDPVPNADRANLGSSFAPDEVGVALHLARGTAAARLYLAERLLRVLPATFALWQAGRIDTAKARAIHDATVVLTDELAATVEAKVLARAPEQSLPQLRAALARVIISVDPTGAAERHRAARTDRRVCLGQEDDGMASLWALLSAPDATGAYEWLTRLARGLGPDDPRGIDARRADLMVALLTGQLVADADITLTDDAADDTAGTAVGDTTGSAPDDADAARDEAAGHDATPTRDDTTSDDTTGPSSTGTGTTGRHAISVRPVTPGKPLIQIVMAHSTLIGADDQPAELVGEGPIPAGLAREIAADAVWHRLVTDPLSGTVLDYGRTTYHPPAGLADHIRARDQHCRFPLCRRRAADAELDHIVAWADGGETNAANLHALCRRHHTLKHHTGWRIEAHPNGRLTWITPTGHRHTTTPHDYGPEPPPAPPAAPSPDDSTDPRPPPDPTPPDPTAPDATPAAAAACHVDPDPPPF
jgi:hypothetical protein